MRHLIWICCSRMFHSNEAPVKNAPFPALRLYAKGTLTLCTRVNTTSALRRTLASATMFQLILQNWVAAPKCFGVLALALALNVNGHSDIDTDARAPTFQFHSIATRKNIFSCFCFDIYPMLILGLKQWQSSWYVTRIFIQCNLHDHSPHASASNIRQDFLRRFWVSTASQHKARIGIISRENR